MLLHVRIPGSFSGDTLRFRAGIMTVEAHAKCGL